MIKLYIDTCRDERGFMRATDCLQSHEDTLRGNSIHVIPEREAHSENQALRKIVDELINEINTCKAFFHPGDTFATNQNITRLFESAAHAKSELEKLKPNGGEK